MLISQRLKKIPFWTLGAILYGISWPLPWNINISFLAWIAFIFLFISLENNHQFFRSIGLVWMFSLLAYTISSGWFLGIPKNKELIIIGAISESLNLVIPFMIAFPVRKYVGFSQMLYVLPFIFVVCEWSYSFIEHNLNYLLIAHSQTENTWLIQYIDVFGYLSITFWVMLFNVLVYSILVRANYRVLSVNFIRKVVVVSFIMVFLPLVYAFYKQYHLKDKSAETIRVSLLHTDFNLLFSTQEQKIKRLERIVEITDSADYYNKLKKVETDLYVWFEGAIPYGNNYKIQQFVRSAVTDWNTPLLSGCDHVEPFYNTSLMQSVNRVILFAADSSQSLQYYDKNILTPGWESFPYISWLHQLGWKFMIESEFYKKGNGIRLFEFEDQGKRNIKIGTPICFEQSYSTLWNQMSLLGADFFIQLSFETWFGETYFQKQMAYITRLRAVETRHSVARCSNGGLTMFINSFGQVYDCIDNSETMLENSIDCSNEITFFTRHTNLFPVSCLIALCFYSVYIVLRKQPFRNRIFKIFPW